MGRTNRLPAVLICGAYAVLLPLLPIVVFGAPWTWGLATAAPPAALGAFIWRKP